MPLAELENEIAAGTEFRGYDADGSFPGVMGIQPVRDVDLIPTPTSGLATRGWGSAVRSSSTCGVALLANCW
jgi:hypothetical protein